jgi:hypothetical protein
VGSSGMHGTIVALIAIVALIVGVLAGLAIT